MQKAWNIPNLPVYSLATYADGQVNMNICTYVSAVSMKPKLYSLAIYHQTKTLANIEKSQVAVLQLLHQSQFNLVKKLGQTSGKNYNKQAYLAKKDLLEDWHNYPVLKNTSAKILLAKISSITTGDHDLYIFSVLKSTVQNKEYLLLDTLREKQIIRG